MDIRDIKLSDFEKVNEVMKEVHNLHVKHRPDLYLELDEPYPIEKFKEDIRNEDTISILAEEANDIMGICFVSFREQTCMVKKCTAYMDDLCVLKKYRGQGIGTKLFNHAIELAKKKGAKRLDLMVWGFNRNAIEFYEKMNMQVQRLILETEL